MRQHILATALAAAVTALAYGQNLNPTVEVTNAYEGGASSIAKPARTMAVPDSVTRFNLDFDYSVFEKPYQGAYEFTPYYVQLKPTPKPSTTEKFYLRAGAGFTLHPELDLVWTPLQKEKFRLSVYATHQSYFGRYHDFALGTPQDGITPVVKSGDKMKGYLADTKAGIDGTFNWDGGLATLDLGFRNRMADDAYQYQKMSGLEARARVRSLPSDELHLMYDATIDYSFLGGDLSSFHRSAKDFRESKFDLAGDFGPALDADRRILVGVNLDLARYMGDYAGYTGRMALTPKYQFDLDRWRFSLGAQVSWLIYSEDFNLWTKDFQHKSGFIYPDVHIDFHAVDDRLVLQTSATGGDRFNTLSGQFFSHPFSWDSRYGHSVERVRAMIGARGNFASRFRYDLQGGYARWTYAPVEGMASYLISYLAPSGSDSGILQPAETVEHQVLRPWLVEKGFNLLFVDLDYGWKSESVTVDGRLSYRHSNIAGTSAFAPAAFTGFIRPAYNYGERMKGGLDIAWSTGRKASVTTPSETGEVTKVYRVPGWVDLGVFAEYRFTHRFGFWAKGGNLLNQVVQKTPLHAEAGMYFTAGIVLNF
jgi:hypothetical protein